jgi:hypothetical protein
LRAAAERAIGGGPDDEHLAIVRDRVDVTDEPSSENHDSSPEQ